MRILIVTCHQSVVGGIEKYLQAVIPALLKRGHSVALLYEHAAQAGEITVDPPDASLPIWFWNGGANPPALLEEVARWRPDVTYSNGVDSLEIEDFLFATGPTVFYAHVYHGTCAAGRKCQYFPRPQPCHRKFGPMCLVLHYPKRCGGLNPLVALRLYKTQAGHNARLTRYESILVASTHMRGEFERNDIGPEKLHLLPLPITGIRAENAERAGRPAPHSILFAGRLVHMKGVDNLLQAIPLAAERLGRRLDLTVAGDGWQRNQLERDARQAGFEVRFTGWLESVGTADLMRQADLLAVPSLWPEPFGLVGIEAGCFSLPAVGYAVGGIPDWLIAGQTGEIAPGDPPTVPGLTDAIVRALGDQDHYERLCRGALKLSSEFTLERHLGKLESVLEASSRPNTSGFSADSDHSAVASARQLT